MNAVFFPILIPLTAIMLLFFFRSQRFSHAMIILGSSLLLVSSLFLLWKVNHEGVLALYMGAWEAPYGITLVIDYFSVLMLIISAFVFLAVSIYKTRFLPPRTSGNRFSIFFFSLAMGVNGSFIAGDVFNLFVWFELMLISSFVLITFYKRQSQLHAGIKYLGMNLLGSMFFLAGIGLLYGKTGTLNMAHLAELFRENGFPPGLNTSATLIFLAFGIKSAVFPLFFWLPASYHTPNITITALFAGLLTKVGVYAMIRFFTLFFTQDQDWWHTIFLVIAGLTMLYGGMAATTQYKLQRILSFHIISQIGYMVMGLGIFTPLAIAGSIYFMMHNMIAKTNTFLVAGMIHKIRRTYDLKSIGGLYKEDPLLAVLFIIPAFALAGIPPLSGFFAKFILIKAGVEAGQYLISAVALLTGLLTLYSMIKIWNEAFLKAQPPDKQPVTKKRSLIWIDYLPSLILGALSIFMGIFANTVFGLTEKAAAFLLNTAPYIENVLIR
jgi:multicomponent Na+:H+ antiporter subunit D